MEFTIAEVAAASCSLAILAFLVAGSGAILARLLDFPGFGQADRLERAGIALLCGFGCTPVLLDLAGRFGPRAMTLAAVALALAGVPALLRAPASPPRQSRALWIAISLAWIFGGLLFLADWPTRSGLLHAFTVIDHTKHSVATWIVAQTGTPPQNPTFHEAGRTAAYYYFYYTLTGAAHVIGGPLGLSARHAGYAGAILSGFVLFALGHAVWKRSGADEAVGADPKKPAGLLLLALLLTTGADLIPAVVQNVLSPNALIYMNIEFWNDQIGSWMSDAMWVPHHIAALCSAFIGFIALSDTDGRIGPRRIALAALAFAAMAGLSVYIAMGAALTAVFWLAVLARAKRWRDIAVFSAAGLGALIVAAPWLLTLTRLVGGGGPSPVAFYVRGAHWVDEVAPDPMGSLILRSVTVLPFFLFEFGVFALGSWVFWRKAGRRGFETDIGKILVCATAAAFLIGAFFRSTILNNDLGWRVMMFAQLATLVWTMAAARAGLLFAGEHARPAKALLWLGYAAVAISVFQLHILPPQSDLEQATQRDEVSAWTWLDAKLPTGAVVQSQPDLKRNYAYGLYGQFPEAVSDHHNGRLFGATVEEVEARIAILAPLFADPALTVDDARARAQKFGIAALVVTALDPVFASSDAWTAKARPDYSNDHVRIFLMDSRAGETRR